MRPSPARPHWRYTMRGPFSSLYTVSGTHAVEIRPDLKHLDVNDATESYAPLLVETLEIIAHGGDAPHAPRYISNWTRNFDYVYLLGLPSKNILPHVLDELTVERRFTLYHTASITT